MPADLVAEDVLSDSLAGLQIERIVLVRTEFRGRVALELAAAPSGSMVHVVEEGSIVMETASSRHLVSEGSVALIPEISASRIGPAGATLSVAVDQVPREYSPNGFKWVRVGDGGLCCRLFTAHVSFRRPQTHPLLGAMLGSVIVPPSERGAELDALVALLTAEMGRARPGLRLAAENLIVLFMVALLRVRAQRAEGLSPGILRALRDPRLARVLGAVSGSPEAPWTLGQLARRAGVSRSRLTALFREQVGMTTTEYITHWRILRAQQLLLDGEDGLAGVASRVGYGSDVALSRAFKRVTGVSPGAWRRQGRK